MAVSRSTIAAIRFGYGLSADAAPPADGAALLDGLSAAATTPLLAEPTPLRSRLRRLREVNQQKKREGDTEEVKAARRQMMRDTRQDLFDHLVQRAEGPSAFFERICAFWSDHFTVSARGPLQRHLAPAYEPETIRPNVMGRFEDMLIAVTRSPMMLHYLDQGLSIGPGSRVGKRRGRGLNENFARELLELHTLGVDGPYTQDDVRQLAELLTGFSIDRRKGGFVYRPNIAEPGPETVLGRSYGGGRPRVDQVDRALTDLAHHPVTARHLARKLAVHFTADNPDPKLIAHLERVWTDTGGDLPQVYAALVEHPASWATFGAKVKKPAEFVVSVLCATRLHRAIGRTNKGRHDILTALRELNQPLFAAPGPDGWPEAAEAWITPQGLAARLAFASTVGHQLARDRTADPRDFARMALGDTLRDDTAFAVGAAPDRWEGFALALASPEFNRR
ncbi:MAG: DUF1800 domain-containing protein [Pseudomonadota bacterium]